jgi:site-specific DNA-adenine methylase
MYKETMQNSRVSLKKQSGGSYMNSFLAYMGGKSLLTKKIITFSRDDFQKLRDILSGIKGKFIMSINDTPEIRKLYKGFHTEVVATTYSAGGANKKKSVNELLIMNYQPG